MIYDYAIFWIGWRTVLSQEEFEKVTDRSHSWVQFAEAHEFKWYHDTFQNYDEEGESLATLLVGQKVDMLGYKEGVFELGLTDEEVLAIHKKLAELTGKWNSMPKPSLWVLFHMEE